MRQMYPLLPQTQSHLEGLVLQIFAAFWDQQIHGLLAPAAHLRFLCSGPCWYPSSPADYVVAATSHVTEELLGICTWYHTCPVMPNSCSHWPLKPSLLPFAFWPPELPLDLTTANFLLDLLASFGSTGTYSLFTIQDPNAYLDSSHPWPFWPILFGSSLWPWAIYFSNSMGKGI